MSGLKTVTTTTTKKAYFNVKDSSVAVQEEQIFIFSKIRNLLVSLKEHLYLAI